MADQQQKSKSGGTRKHGRNKAKCAAIRKGSGKKFSASKSRRHCTPLVKKGRRDQVFAALTAERRSPFEAPLDDFMLRLFALLAAEKAHKVAQGG